MNRITIHHAWAEVLRPAHEADGTFLVPCEGLVPNEDALRGILRHLVPLATHPSITIHDSVINIGTHCESMAREVFAVVARPPLRRSRGVALVAPRRFQNDWPYLPSIAVILLVWGLDVRNRLHLRVVRREVGRDWLASNSTMPFGLACWPDHWPHDGDPEAPSLKDDPTLWRVLYPELDSPPRPHTFQHRELLYAVLDEPGDPLHWDALADAVEEQDLDPSRERFASRLLREMILPGGATLAPGLVRREVTR